jgi:hypothetical protein
VYFPRNHKLEMRETSYHYSDIRAPSSKTGYLSLLLDLGRTRKQHKNDPHVASYILDQAGNRLSFIPKTL